MESEVPRVMITFSEEDLSSLDKQCQGYLSRMQEIARQKTISRSVSNLLVDYVYINDEKYNK